MLDTAVGDTTTDAPVAPVSEGSPASIDSSSQPGTDTADRPQPSDKGFAEKALALANAGSEIPKRGPIPLDAHERVLGKTRADFDAERKAWEAERAEWEQYGWAKQVDPAQLERYAELDRRLAADPVSVLAELAAAVRSNPQYAPQLRSWTARELASAMPQPQAARAEEPKPDVRYQDPATGQIHEWYSAQGQAKRDAWLREQMMTELRGELAPLQEGVNTFQQLHQQAAIEKVSTEKAKEIFDTVSALPGFHEHKDAIAEEVAASFKRLRIPAEAGGNPEIIQAILSELSHKAWAKIAAPKLTEAGRQQAISGLEAKARASTRNPKTSATAPPSKDDTRSFAEKMAEKFRHPQS